MWKSRGPAAAVLALAALPAPSHAETPEKQPFTLTNTADRVAYCTVLVDGRTHVQLALRAGKTWSDAIDPRRAQPFELAGHAALAGSGGGGGGVAMFREARPDEWRDAAALRAPFLPRRSLQAYPGPPPV